ncbi:MAG: hypothetical protein KF894_00560 [Labilithrix sp.]|nr:hypothetical protein [Labilithrix sp.]
MRPGSLFRTTILKVGTTYRLSCTSEAIRPLTDPKLNCAWQMMLGRVDDVDGHYVATKFHGLIFPTSSMYVVGETYSRSGNVSTMTLVGLALFFAFVPGRLSSREKGRLRLLGRVTGMRIDPKHLTVWTRGSKREFLDAELTKSGVTTTPEGILAASEAASTATLEAPYAFACYAGDGPDWRGAAARLLARHDALHGRGPSK